MEISNSEKLDNINKEKFSIFLDFDGVLNDYETIKSFFLLGGFFVSDINSVFKEDSIVAMNYLIKSLQEKFDVELILSTTWRRNFSKAISALYNNGLIFYGEIHKTSIMFPHNRTKEIKQYLSKNKIENNFLIIDDKRKIDKVFDKEHCIKTSFRNDSLNMSKVLDYLDKYQVELGRNIPLEDYNNFPKSSDFEKMK